LVEKSGWPGLGQTAETLHPAFVKPMASRAVLGHRFVAVSNTFGLAEPLPSEFESTWFIYGPSRMTSANGLSVSTCLVLTNGHFVLLPAFGALLLDARHRAAVRRVRKV